MVRWSLPSKLFKGPAYETPSGKLSVEADEEKISFRMQVYEATGPHQTVLDLYAGKGYLAWLYAKHGCEKLICVEKNPRYFRVLRRNLAEFAGKISLYNMDNLRWLEQHLNPEETITFVDFDAYGSPALQIQRFFAKYPVRRVMVACLTDGLLFNLRRVSNANLKKLYLQDFYLNGLAGKPGKPGSIQNLGEYVFQIQRSFFDILAMRFGFQAFPLYFKVNSRRTAAYSAYLLLPKLVGDADFKRYVGLRVTLYGGRVSAEEGSGNLKQANPGALRGGCLERCLRDEGCLSQGDRGKL
ncbi:MAG: RsmD family RNA methyltransferase [Candidatus Hecatellaceae archaeon]